MKFQSDVPDFMNVDPQITLQEFNSIEDLLNHPYIKSWVNNHKDFKYCWDFYEGEWSKALLMVDWINPNNKREWWVLGYMDEIPTSLPQWRSPSKEEWDIKDNEDII